MTAGCHKKPARRIKAARICLRGNRSLQGHLETMWHSPDVIPRRCIAHAHLGDTAEITVTCKNRWEGQHGLVSLPEGPPRSLLRRGSERYSGVLQTSVRYS